MTLLLRSILLVTLSYGAATAAPKKATSEGLCINTVQEYDDLKFVFPKKLQTLPAHFRSTSDLVKAGFIVSKVDDSQKLKLRFMLGKSNFTEGSDIETYIEKACVKNNTLKVTLEDGDEYDFKVEGDELIFANKTLKFKSVDESALAPLMKAPKTAPGDTSAPASPAPAMAQ